QEDNNKPLLAITYKRMGKSYAGRQMYAEADEQFKKAQEILSQLALCDPDLEASRKELANHYSILDMSRFGEKALQHLKDAGVSRISILKSLKGTRVQIELAERLIQDIKAKAVSKIGFDKVIAFDFKSLGDNRFALANIQGLQVRTKFWVSLIDSIMGLDQNQRPKAQVTGEKMGKQKIVEVTIPEKIYNQSMDILNQLKESIDELINPNNPKTSTTIDTSPETDNESGLSENRRLRPVGPMGENRLDKFRSDGLFHPPDIVAPPVAPQRHSPGALKYPPGGLPENIKSLPQDHPALIYP
ncbi:MAG: hypothetical protein K8F91_05740, partial [Candidatus Obscuribacterales bacterium]|nr:hypothetical protein [Candidatus Obscuribacterales bacterium]